MRKLVLLLLAAVALPALASDPAVGVDKIVDGVIAAYGGEAAWKSVASIEQKGTTTSAMGGSGAMTRTWQRAHKLRVEIAYADHTEVRDVDGATGTRNGKPVTGLQLDAMTLQWARLAIPILLIEQRAKIHDLGEKDGLRVLEIPLNDTLTVMAAVDPKTFHVVRSASKGTMNGQTIEFVTEYKDLRKQDGLLFAFTEENFAQGMKTADTKIESVKVGK